MGVKVDEYDQICVVEIDGDFSGENARLTSAAMENQTQQRKVVNFVIDLAKCAFIDSEGLETLLAIKRRCEDMFGQIKLARLDDNCRQILQLTRLEHRFEMHGELVDALKMMR